MSLVGYVKPKYNIGDVVYHIVDASIYRYTHKPERELDRYQIFKGTIKAVESTRSGAVFYSVDRISDFLGCELFPNIETAIEYIGGRVVETIKQYEDLIEGEKKRYREITGKDYKFRG